MSVNLKTWVERPKGKFSKFRVGSWSSLARTALRDRRALSSVIGEIILCTSVFGIGTALWAFSRGYMSYEMTNYWQKVSVNIYGLKERFMVENVAFNSTGTSSGSLHVWVYNYGDIDIQVNLYIFLNGSVIAEDVSGATITSKSIVEFPFDLNEVSTSNELVIKVETLRGNVNYGSYTIP